MNISTMLHTLFEMSPSNPIKDKRRLKAVLACTDALCDREVLTLTGIGRGIKNTTTKVKHSIKRVCRLLGNPHLQQERIAVYGFIAHALLTKIQHPIIIVDWSPVVHVDKQLLRAVTPIGGRAFTLYEEVHPEKLLGSMSVHRKFIRRLSKLIPEGVTPIITTDAGFKVPWYKPVEEQGWFWLGRVRGNSKIKLSTQWLTVDQLFSQATVKPRHLGDGELTKVHQHSCQMVLYKKKSKGRQDKTYRGNISQDVSSRKHAKGEREPWLLVSNLPKEDWFAERIVALYTQRMQIEEGFRDTKNERYGLALNFSGSECCKRIEILLMIGMLTQLALLLIGKSAYIKGYYKDFQANSIRCRRVLSFFYLGKEIIGRESYSFNVKDIALALGGLKAKAEATFY